MNYYDQIADGYDKLHREEQEKKLSIVQKNLKINKKDRVLDVGCGTCISSQIQCRWYGIDPSERLLLQGPEVNKILAKGETLPFEDDCFDVVICITAIHNFDDIEKGLQEMKRVGKTRFGISVLRKSKSHDKIVDMIKKNFAIDKTFEEKFDTMLFSF